MRKPRKNLINQRFGNLVVVDVELTTKRISWKCKCDCGGEALVATDKLLSGHTRSCGCLQKQKASEANKVHGSTNCQLYRVWSGIKSRCNYTNHKNFKEYGDRGIKMCPEWEASYPLFEKWCIEESWKPGLTVERIDNNKGYSPDNCKICSMKEQGRNKRNNVYVGNILLEDFFNEISKETGLTRSGIVTRYYRLKKLGYEITKENIINYKKCVC